MNNAYVFRKLESPHNPTLGLFYFQNTCPGGVVTGIPNFVKNIIKNATKNFIITYFQSTPP